MQRAFKTGDLIFLGVALVVMIGLTTISYVISPPQSVGARGSTYSAQEQGAKAAFLLLKQLGYRVERSYEPIAAITAKPSTTVLVLASPARRASLQDVRALRSFIEAGGVVVATGGGGSFLPGMSSVTIVEDSVFARLARRQQEERQRQQDAGKRTVATGPIANAVEFYATMPSPLTRGTPTLLIESEIDGKPPQPDAYEAIYSNTKEGSGVLLASFGRGEAIWAIGSTPFLNAAIDKPGHLEFLLNLVGAPGRNRLVLWDEYYHGYDRGLLSYFATSQLSTAFAQLVLIALLALFTFSRRRGPLRPLLMRPRASAMEFVDAVSALYQKARAGQGAVETTRARLRRVLIASSQLPANSSDTQLAAAASVRHGIDERELRRLLAESKAVNDETTLPGDEALKLVQRMQAMVGKALG
jgi:Domain of unknown function (DUF4350)